MAFVSSSSALTCRPTDDRRHTNVCPSSAATSSFTTGTVSSSSIFLGTKTGHVSCAPCSSFRYSPQCTLAKPQSRTGIKSMDTPGDLHRLLHAQSVTDVTVVMCSAGYCAGCRGAAPKYKKVAAAYADDRDVTFAKMDFVTNEQFCREALGVDNLPFFVVFKGERISSGEAMGWRVVTKKLVDRIESAVAKKPVVSGN